jgi:guanylate kinase/deoxycytidine triphosphate deaminase
MEYKGIGIIGTSGAGKSTVAQKLCKKYEIFNLVQAVTTREERQNGILGQYQYITEEEFKNLDKGGKLLIRTKYRGKYYGITHEALQQVVDNGKIPLLILTPKVVSELEGKGDRERYVFFTIFLDAPDDILDRRLEQRGEKIDENIRNQRKEDREYARICRYVINNSNGVHMEDVTQLLYSLWEYRNVGGMLPQKIIELMIRCGMLLRNAEINKLQGASYDLSLGDRYWQNGELRTLNDNNPFINLKPGDYVIVSSKETADFPRDIAGRFDLTVGLFCQGVILSNGPQVDPSFKGGLFCLLFNTSDAEITLKRGDHYATLEFIKLLEPTIPYSGKYQGKKDIIDYLPKPSKPSAIVKLRNDIEDLKKAKWYEKTLPLILSILAIVASIVMGVILFFIK